MSLQCAAAHHQCLIVYLKQCGLPLCQGLDCIRTIALFRSPWSKLPQLCLRPNNQIHAEVIDRIAARSGLARLQSLPPELLHAIRQLSPHALLWRTMRTIALALQASLQKEPTQTFALAGIRQWCRESRGLAFAHDQQSLIKITVDSSGIREITRLHEWPPCCLQNSESESYIIEEAARLSGVKAQLKVPQLSTPSS